jgi:hypothetical protein
MNSLHGLSGATLVGPPAAAAIEGARAMRLDPIAANRQAFYFVTPLGPGRGHLLEPARCLRLMVQRSEKSVCPVLDVIV